ncbi:MAG: hypothetical protein JST36_03050 [Bacteroidetes bacterium]|nr:hypothetical protein [Bacteroidota bacterium]
MTHLPEIVAAAKRRPLSYNPITQAYIYYDELAQGTAKLYPLEKLSPEQLKQLVIERQLSNTPTEYATLQDVKRDNEAMADEIRKETKLGKQILQADKDYLEFYLEQFPKECFEP